MKERELNALFNGKGLLDGRIEKLFLAKALFKVDSDDSEIKGHMEKAEHNLRFVSVALKMGYTDWAVTGCYYAIYQAALALILNKGFFSKSHDATLCILIRHYYKGSLGKQDIELFNKAYLDNQNIISYVESKTEREKASYSTLLHFNKEQVNALRVKAMLFVRKCALVLEKR
ncbi:MAG: HEPN domain-containing protein [Nanoarchaeota archaeon]|nr:HEPN domain-containing protein [Nanoarchaeota archaeon]